jgi:ABC-type Mn2+/Zn2+ transport system permease subunit
MEVKSLLYGDLILASPADAALIAAVLVPAGLVFLAVLRPTLNAFLDREAARVLGGRPALWETLFFVILGLVVSASARVAGALLVFCCLVVTPATALLLARRFGLVLAAAALCGMGVTLAGLLLSLRYDLPTNQVICAAACVLFAVVAAGRALWNVRVRMRRDGHGIAGEGP